MQELTFKFECKKYSCAQLSNGMWKLTLVVDPQDFPDCLLKAAPDQRFLLAGSAIGDDEKQIETNNIPQKNEKKEFYKIPYSHQCAIKCLDQKFVDWFMMTFMDGTHGDIERSIKAYLGIESRSELDRDKDKAMKWVSILSMYEDERLGRI